MDVQSKPIPVRWVLERDAADPAPILINAQDYDPARHVPVETAPGDVPATELPATSSAGADEPRRSRRGR